MYLFTISKKLTNKKILNFLAILKYNGSEQNRKLLQNGKLLQNAKTNVGVKEIKTFVKG